MYNPIIGRKSPTGIGVHAYVLNNGERRILLTRCSDSDKFMRIVRKMMEGRAGTMPLQIADWQSSWGESVQDVAQVVTTHFGMGWFNKARAQLIKLGWKPKSEITEAEEAGRAAFQSISGRMSDGKGFDYPKCPYRRPERAAAWKRGFDEMLAAFDDAMREAA